DWSTASPRRRLPERVRRAPGRPPPSSRDSSGSSTRRWNSSASSRAARSVKTATDLARALLLVGLVPVLAQAAATGRSQIPTPDLVPWKQLTLQTQNGNTEVSGDASVWRQPQVQGQTQFGLPWSMEAGLDVVSSNAQQDYRPEVNVKWVPLQED